MREADFRLRLAPAGRTQGRPRTGDQALAELAATAEELSAPALNVARMNEKERAFAEIADRLRTEPDIDEGTGFGSSPGLRVNRKIFAMLVRDELVLKLPATRCAELVSAGVAIPFERGRGRPTKEWITLHAALDTWPTLTDEALTYVRTTKR